MAWKAFERTVARVLGGERRGANTTTSRGQGRSDVIHPWLSPECKLLSTPTLGQIREAVAQSEQAAANEGEGKLPVAVVGTKGGDALDALVCLRLETFRELVRRASPV